MEEIDISASGKNYKVSVRNEADKSVVAEIFKLREYRRAEEVITSARYPILDMGAHIGLFSLYCRALNPKIKILAIEPDPSNLKILRKNLSLNKIANIDIIEAAVAGETGKGDLALDTDGLNNRIVYEKKKTGSIKVNTLSLSDLLKKFKRVSLIKMDVEGAEEEILDSLASEDWSRVESFMLEYHNKNRRGIEETLRTNGFGVQVFPSKFDKTMGFIFASNKRLK
jgi:FkbM family methyltransferase